MGHSRLVASSRTSATGARRGLVVMQQLGPAAMTLTLFAAAFAVAAAPPTSLNEFDRLNHEVLAEMVGFRSSAAFPDQTKALVATTAARLRAGGFADSEVQIINSEPGLWGLVVRYAGTGGDSPLLVMAHLDVVDAEPEAWSSPPFALHEKEGFYWGRGTNDNKAGAAMLVATFLRLRAEAFKPRQDLVLVLTGDEETDGKVIQWMVQKHPWVRSAKIALNTDAGQGTYDQRGEPLAFYVQTSEKVYQSFRLTAKNPGGHSSLPRADNAIYVLARALVKLSAFAFPLHVDDNLRMTLRRSAEIDHDGLADDLSAVAARPPDPRAADRLSTASPLWNSMLRTTCVATQLLGGHAENALPRSASATVNCRVYPGGAIDDVEHTLRRIVADDSILFERINVAVPSPPSPFSGRAQERIEKLANGHFPGVAIIPAMSTGATDGLFVRNVGIPTYGVSAMFEHDQTSRAHGLDERIGVDEFFAAAHYWYELVRVFTE